MPISADRIALAITFLLRSVGYLLCSAWFARILGWNFVGRLALCLTALHAIARYRGGGVLWRFARVTVRVVLVVLHVWLVTLAVVLGILLAWAVPPCLDVLTGVLALGTALTYWKSWRGVCIPSNLALGVWIVACLIAWERGDASIRCEDIRRTLEQADVQIVAPTVARARCDPRHQVAIERYPRKIIESADGSRYLFTTGLSAGAANTGVSAFDGSICELPTDGSQLVHCVGIGTGHGIIDATRLGTYIVPVYGDFDDARGLIYVIPQTRGLSIVDTLRTPLTTAHGFYDATADRLGIFSTDMIVLLLRGVDRAPLPFEPMMTFANDVRYDPVRRQGIVCYAGEVPPSGLAALFDADPFRFRSIGVTWWAPLAFGSGCDWSVDTGAVGVTVPALGVLATIDRDSGKLMAARFVGLGARAVAVDSSRQRIYVGSYFGGSVRALDAQSGREIAHWFVGHYLGDLRVAGNGRALLATSTLGLVQISLE